MKRRVLKRREELRSEEIKHNRDFKHVTARLTVARNHVSLQSTEKLGSPIVHLMIEAIMVDSPPPPSFPLSSFSHSKILT